MASASANASPEEAKMAQELAQDRPTIDSAIKSFVSWVTAKSLTAAEDEETNSVVLLTSQQALLYAKIMSKAINAYTFPATFQKQEERVVAQIWNGLIASQQKPTRFLGRRALMFAWEDVKESIHIEDDLGKAFMDEFGALLTQYSPSIPGSDSDPHLIWDAPGAELGRRRRRRAQRAQETKDQELKSTPTIKELSN